METQKCPSCGRPLPSASSVPEGEPVACVCGTELAVDRRKKPSQAIRSKQPRKIEASPPPEASAKRPRFPKYQPPPRRPIRDIKDPPAPKRTKTFTGQQRRRLWLIAVGVVAVAAVGGIAVAVSAMLDVEAKTKLARPIPADGEVDAQLAQTQPQPRTLGQTTSRSQPGPGRAPGSPGSPPLDVQPGAPANKSSAPPPQQKTPSAPVPNNESERPAATPVRFDEPMVITRLVNPREVWLRSEDGKSWRWLKGVDALSAPLNQTVEVNGTFRFDHMRAVFSTTGGSSRKFEVYTTSGTADFHVLGKKKRIVKPSRSWGNTITPDAARGIGLIDVLVSRARTTFAAGQRGAALDYLGEALTQAELIMALQPGSPVALMIEQKVLAIMTLAPQNSSREVMNRLHRLKCTLQNVEAATLLGDATTAEQFWTSAVTQLQVMTHLQPDSSQTTEAKGLMDLP